ncbi:MAG: hypothetical protein J1G06_04400 [Oscillospiraceae bacterium]|nr:hypothetical protein [Oscillospiraceae bacterium]
MRKTLLVVLVVLSLLTLAGCGSEHEPSPSPTPTATSANINDTYNSNESVPDLMNKALNASTQEQRIEYAKKACERQGVEPKKLTDKELSDLKIRQDEIDVLVASYKQTVESSETMDDIQPALERNRDLLVEQLDNTVLIFYNDILRLEQ